MFDKVTKPFRFSYLYSKCRALKSKTNEKDFFEVLLSSKNYGDIYSNLGQRGYGDFIKEPTYENIHLGLKQHFKYLYLHVTKYLSKEESALFSLFFFGRYDFLDKKQDIREKNSLKEFNALDLEFVNLFEKSLDCINNENKKDLSKILGSYFDNMNIYAIFRLKIFYNAQIHEILPYLFPYGLNFKSNDIKKLLSLNSLSELNDVLEPIYKSSFYDISSLRQVLYQHHYSVLNSVWQGFPFKISIMFSLLRMKEIEVKNIQCIIEGVKYSQTKSDIKRMLLGVNM